MRLPIEMRFAREANVMEPKILMGEAAADQIANAFFELCFYAADPDEEESKILRKLKDEVRDQISRRNDFAHGDWRLGIGEEGAAMLWRTKPGRKTQAWTIKEIPWPEMEEWSDWLQGLAGTVGEVGQLCLNADLTMQIWDKPVRLRDVYRFKPGSTGKRGQKSVASEVKRDGPLAHERKNMFGR
jgi:hypothetical protein